MPNHRALLVYSQPGSLAATVHQIASALAKTKKLMKKAFLSKKIALFAFLIPFALATVGYHCIFVSDAGRGAQGYHIKYPNLQAEQALELEENNRWQNWSAWGIHALIFGVPAGLLGLAVASAIQAVRHHSRKSG
jgi:hypothetical protein